MFEPEKNGASADPDPWEGVDLSLGEGGRRRIGPVIGAWIERFAMASRPVAEWLAWYWHGHIVSSAAVVIAPVSMVDQLRLYRSIGGGPFDELLRAVTVGSAMLRYLDGARSTGRSPNENYSRELLELFSLGVGNYSEADVVAGARALTGWTFDRDTFEARFRPRRHDPTPPRPISA